MPPDLVGEVPDEVKPDLPHGYAPWQPALVNQDPPEHTRVRKLAQKPLTTKALAVREDEIREVADGLIDGFVADGRGDLARTTRRRCPSTSSAGSSASPTRTSSSSASGRSGSPSSSCRRSPTSAASSSPASRSTSPPTSRRRSRARRRDPGDDLISGLILVQEEGEKQLTDREILGIIGQLIIAGFETSAGGISFTLYSLCRRPEILDRVRNDLSLVPAVVEESLRRLTPARGLVRRVHEDCEFGGQKIKAGSNIFALVQSANNDPDAFTCPHEFDIDRDRSEMRKSMHWGIGPHRCIGMPLAKLDLKVAIETAITRLPNLRVAPDQDITVQPGMIFHRPEHLEFEWN